MGKGVVIYPVFVPMIGCPHQCAFCNQRSITGRSITNLISDVKDQVKDVMDTATKRDGHREIAFFGGSFTCLSIELQNTILGLAKPYFDDGIIDGIRISTRPDYISDPILKNLQDKGLTTIELGIQSTDPLVLKASERGYTYEEVLPALKNLKNYDFKIGLQMMAGLPQDTRLKSIRTALDFVDIKPDFVRIYPTLVVKGSALEKLFLQGQYKPLAIEDAIGWVRDLRIVFEYGGIDVIRTGLQSQEGFDEGQDLVAGPYHPAFGEMVESAIYKAWMQDIMQWVIDNNKDIPHNKIIFRVNPSRLSQALGQRKSNIQYLNQIFPGYNISIEQCSDIDRQHIMVILDNRQMSYHRKSFISLRYEGILREIAN